MVVICASDETRAGENGERFPKNAHRFWKNAHRFWKNAHRFRSADKQGGIGGRECDSGWAELAGGCRHAST